MAFIHPARTIPFDDLLREIEDREAKKLVRRDTLGPLAIFNYTKACTWEKAWDPITCLTRGLVLDIVSRKVVATPFPKFFNHGEAKDESWATDGEFEVWDKIDGALGVTFHHDGRWHLATKGAFRSPQAVAGQRILARCHQEAMLLGVTYLVEIVAPETRVIVPYDGERLVLLGCYTEAGKFVDPIRALATADFGFEAPEDHPHLTTIRQVVSVAAALPATKEGFVLHWPTTGRRLKVKGPAYVAAHKAASHCRPLDVWSLLRDGTTETRDAAYNVIPAELKPDWDRMVEILQNAWQDICDNLHEGLSKASELDRKSYASKVAALDRSELRSLAWAYYDYCQYPGDRDWSARSFRKLEQKIFDQIRPDGNVLPGYTPSLAMNNVDEATP